MVQSSPESGATDAGKGDIYFRRGGMVLPGSPAPSWQKRRLKSLPFWMVCENSALSQGRGHQGHCSLVLNLTAQTSEGAVGGNPKLRRTALLDTFS